MNWNETVDFLGSCMPRTVQRALTEQPENAVREIRVRAGGKTALVTAQGEIACADVLSAAQVNRMAEALCEHALYARSEEQRQGFVTLRGGHRMGLCGRVIMQGQSVRALREISSVCIRIAGQWTGAADEIIPHLITGDGALRSVLIIGSPGTGKTTLLRDACRQLSEMGFHMCVVDERSEIAALSDGTAQLDVGPNTDVLDGCPKETGMRWMLRSMAPQMIVTDELGGVMDVQAVTDAARCGVNVMATAHGRDAETAFGRGAMYQLAQSGVFDRCVILQAGSVGQVAGILDGRLRPLSA